MFLFALALGFGVLSAVIRELVFLPVYPWYRRQAAYNRVVSFSVKGMNGAGRAVVTPYGHIGNGERAA